VTALEEIITANTVIHDLLEVVTSPELREVLDRAGRNVRALLEPSSPTDDRTDQEGTP
jgi:hypothetical protein